MAMIYIFLNTMTKLKRDNNYNGHPCILLYLKISLGLLQSCNERTTLTLGTERSGRSSCLWFMYTSEIVLSCNNKGGLYFAFIPYCTYFWNILKYGNLWNNTRDFTFHILKTSVSMAGAFKVEFVICILHSSWKIRFMWAATILHNVTKQSGQTHSLQPRMPTSSFSFRWTFTAPVSCHNNLCFFSFTLPVKCQKPLIAAS